MAGAVAGGSTRGPSAAKAEAMTAMPRRCRLGTPSACVASFDSQQDSEAAPKVSARLSAVTAGGDTETAGGDSEAVSTLTAVLSAPAG